MLRKVVTAIRTFNVEAGLPTLDEARRLVIDEINPATLDLLEAVPELRGDPALGGDNEGVTVVWLQ